LNIAVFFHEFTKRGTPQNKKPCARLRDADRKETAASGDPAMVSGFRMASILSFKSRAACPLRPASRIAAGRSCLGTIPSGNRFPLFKDHARGHDSFCLMPLRIIGFDEPNKTGSRSIMQKRAPSDARVFQ
jgi:hypothetical protein